MCLSCGCGQPNEKHGNSDHITQEQIDKAATAAGITPAEVAENIQSGMSSG
jgi:hypothetical protein